ncbi:MAG: aminopeptidase P N-terminal domain-containing protein [Betaproteobacteria bacterium]|nr:aminopeptidase P N-terminal domain-containing protein [Betaproteobacteria bacterium]MDH5351721.1 aminopeptidase P N-terminal domain-containing protein [Betaproteobacteria bacterium]
MKANEMTDVAVYAERRRRLAATIGEGVAVIATAPERARNRDTHYPYRHDSYFYYLTGFPEPEAALVLAGGAAPRALLFCREKSAEREIWDGHRYGPEGARERFGLDEAHPIGALDEKMAALLADREALWTAVGVDADWDARVMRWLNAVRAQARAGVVAPHTLRDLHAPLDEMRLVKDAHELSLMRRAGAISASAHRRAMLAARAGRSEFEVEAELLYEFRRHGAQFPAYWPIVAGGANACILHYVQNDAPLHDGALLLIDAGCELQGYAADITRTFPVGGRFSGAQRAVYEIVLAAQAAAMAQVRAGRAWNEPHDAAVKVLAQGMLDLKLLDGSLDAVLEKESYKRFYMHRTGHWLGMDVHDAGEYKRAGAWRTLVPGMTLTVEPGLYIRAADDVPEALHDIGVRIEDDVAVTTGECEVLTAAAPKAIGEIEALIRDART